MRNTAFVVVLALVCGEVFAAGGGLTLVENGAPVVSLKLQETAGPEMKKAAADLVTYVNKISGGRIDQVENPKGNIYVGAGYAKDFGADVSHLTPGGYVLKTKGHDLLIAGRTEPGTANGIYGLIMDYLRVRWYGPGDLWETVPHKETIRIPRLNLRSEPDFGYRVYSGMMGEAGADWYRRSRMDTNPHELPYYGFGHNLQYIFPPSTYAADHPEYYAMDSKGGRRVPTPENPGNIGQPCFSNPEVVEISAKAAQEFFERNPTYTTFSLCPGDSPAFCQCPECTKLDSPLRTSRSGGYTNTKAGWVSFSNSYFHFVTAVAEKVAKTNPGKYLGCYAYWSTELPPSNIKRLPDNVSVALTQETSQHFDPVYKRTDREMWLEWSKIAPHLGKYDYYGLGWIAPRYYPTLAADDLKFVHANKADGMYCEEFPFYYMTAPQLYLATQLLWDVDQDPRRILSEYFSDLYGRAAPEMKAFYDILERYWMQPRQGYWLQGGKMFQEFRIANAQLLNEARDLLVRAKGKVAGPELDRLIYVESNFRFTDAVVQVYERARNIGLMPLETEADATRLIREIEAELGDISISETTLRDVVMKDPLHQHTYFTTATLDRRKLAKWRLYTQYSLRKAVKRLDAYCSSDTAPESTKVLLDGLRTRVQTDPIAQKIGLVQVGG